MGRKFKEFDVVSLIIEQVESFRTFVLDRLSSAKSDSRIEELFDEWCLANLPQDQEESDLEAISAALKDLENGVPTRPVEEFCREFRAKHNI